MSIRKIIAILVAAVLPSLILILHFVIVGGIGMLGQAGFPTLILGIPLTLLAGFIFGLPSLLFLRSIGYDNVLWITVLGSAVGLIIGKISPMIFEISLGTPIAFLSSDTGLSWSALYGAAAGSSYALISGYSVFRRE